MTSLDHVVVNALRDTDAAEALFAGLGFTLTPRGYHTLGSVNHLMMTPGAYLEIVGVPPTGKQRQEVLDSPAGLSGLVLKSEDADATHARVVAAGFDPMPPLAFSRPVEIDGQSHDASFRTVRMKPDFFGGGRVYFCQHLTPELVWRPEWLEHENGFCAIDRIAIEHPDPATCAADLAGCFGAGLSQEGEAQVVTLADATITVTKGAAARVIWTGLVFAGLDALAARAGALPGVAWEPLPDGSARLTLTQFSTTFLCRSEP